MKNNIHQTINYHNNEFPLTKLLKPLDTSKIFIKKHSIKFLPIGPDMYLWLITSGCLLGLRGNMEGDIKGTGLNGPNDILGLSGFSGVTKDVSFYALCDSVLLRIPTREFTNLMKKDVELSSYMISYLSNKFVKSLEELENSTLLTLSERMEIFEDQLEMLTKETVDIPNNILAFAVGAHPGSVCRINKGK